MWLQMTQLVTHAPRLFGGPQKALLVRSNASATGYTSPRNVAVQLTRTWHISVPSEDASANVIFSVLMS